MECFFKEAFEKGSMCCDFGGQRHEPGVEQCPTEIFNLCQGDKTVQQIPDDLLAQFADSKGRRELIQKYSSSAPVFFGKNADEELIILSFGKEKILILQTFQSNGWLRVDTYDADGYHQDEMYQGKWRGKEAEEEFAPPIQDDGYTYSVIAKDASVMTFHSFERFVYAVQTLRQMANEHGSITCTLKIEKGE